MTEENIVGIAMVCHEANRAYCHSLGDESQLPWDEAPAWQQTSAISGVRGIIEEDRTAEQSHEAWMKEKLAAGWVYGEVKDPEAKTHPCLVSYALLPPTQRFKDDLFGAIARLMISALGATPL